MNIQHGSIREENVMVLECHGVNVDVKIFSSVALKILFRVKSRINSTNIETFDSVSNL